MCSVSTYRETFNVGNLEELLNLADDDTDAEPCLPDTVDPPVQVVVMRRVLALYPNRRVSVVERFTVDAGASVVATRSAPRPPMGPGTADH